MTITADHETPRDVTGEGFSDAVTVAFGDAAAEVYGVARVGLSAGPEGPVASGLVLLFADGQPAAVRADGGVAAPAGAWPSAAGVTMEIVEPLARWSVAFEAQDGTASFALELEAISDPAVLDASNPAAKLGGMEGYEQLVRVSGDVRIGGAYRKVECLGQRGHSWGSPDWEKLSMARTVGAWMEGGAGVTLTAVRSAKGQTHADEEIGAFYITPGEEGLSAPQAVGDPRLSTTYDGDGRQQSAGLELYLDPDDGHAHRAAGEVTVGTTLDLGRLRLDCAFFHWRMEGREGVGRYDILRRVT